MSLDSPLRQMWLTSKWMWRMRGMVTYAIHTDPGTYAHLEPKSFEKMIEQVPTRGWNSTTPQWKKEPLSSPARCWKPTTPQQKNDLHSTVHTKQLQSQLLLVNFNIISDKVQIKRALFSLIFPAYVQFCTRCLVLHFFRSFSAAKF